MPEGRQHQRHGVSNSLVEGIGGALIGAAAVLLLRDWLGRRRTTPTVATVGADPAPAAAAAPASEASPKARPRRRDKGAPNKE